MGNNKYKKVLVTGADGFIGSHLTELLYKKGYQVINGGVGGYTSSQELLKLIGQRFFGFTLKV